jgi:hypothetical protein
MSLYQRIRKAIVRQMTLPGRLEQIQEALGRIESRQQAGGAGRDPREFEFRVYSQWGEDGIIDHLVANASITSRSFVEFGVESYTEANTLFLLKHRHWRGLIIDGSPEHIETVRRSNVFWRHDLSADSSFITRENINDIIRRNGFAGELGLLSVDIDGNDYWVWQALDCVSPCIVVSEYNSLFGPAALISTPYQADFRRTVAHASNMYYGASISALTHLAAQRGYTLVAGNSAGNNVFFVRNDCLGPLKPQTVEQAYVKAGFRESHSATGKVLSLDFASRQAEIGNLPVVDVLTQKTLALKDAL